MVKPVNNVRRLFPKFLFFLLQRLLVTIDQTSSKQTSTDYNSNPLIQCVHCNVVNKQYIIQFCSIFFILSFL